jgi:hypothetical protein
MFLRFLKADLVSSKATTMNQSSLFDKKIVGDRKGGS